MNTNLDKIALDLYGKIQTRFSDIKIGDQHADVLSKKEDIPKARFFEFEYLDSGKKLGTITITLDDDDGVVVQTSGDLANKQHEGAFRFIRGLRSFAKDRLLNFDIQNMGKNNLDKRDYEFQSKSKEQEPMEPIMESKLYGTTRMSYQDLGEARLVVKHSQPINTELAAGRTMHIESIYIENAQGERFRYPYKHLNGARALAEHIKAGGNPYDTIGQHISGLSEELAQLRKFKNYVGRNNTLSEAMDDINGRVNERIEAVKKEVQSLQRPTYYKAFAESFEANESQDIPEEILNDWIDRLTIRTFNEELKTAFPYIYRLVGENIPTKELGPEDILDEGRFHHQVIKFAHHYMKHHDIDALASEDVDIIATELKLPMHIVIAELELAGIAPQDDMDETSDNLGTGGGNIHNGYRGDSVAAKVRHHLEAGEEYKDALAEVRAETGLHRAAIDKLYREHYGDPANVVSNDPEEQFESFLDRIVNEDGEDDEGKNELFSKDQARQSEALNKLKELISTGLKPGVDGVNAVLSLKGIIDSQVFTDEYLEGLSDEDDVGTAIKLYLQDLSSGKISEPDIPKAKDIAQQIIATKALNTPSDTPVGGEEAPASGAAGATPPAPAPGAEATAGAPPAPAPGAEAAAGAPGAPPVAESISGSHPKARLIKAIHTAKKHGAKLDTTLDFGHKEMTLHDCIHGCGMEPKDFGFDQDDSEDGVHQMLKSISGFWNKEAKNFTIGGTRAKTKVVKDFKNGEFSNATEEDLRHVLHMIDKMDPSHDGNDELGHIRHLSGMNQEHPRDAAMNHQMSELETMDQQPQTHMQESMDELSSWLKIAGLRK